MTSEGRRDLKHGLEGSGAATDTPSPRRAIKLLLNIAGATLARLGGLLTTLLIVPITLSGLGPIQYGYLSTLLSASILFSYADLGLSLSLVNTMASLPKKGEVEEELRGVFSFLIMVFLGLSILSMVSGTAFILAGYGDISITRAYIVAFVMVSAGIPAGIAQRVLYARQRNIEAGLWLIAGRIATIAVLLVCSRVGATFEWYVYGIFGGPLMAAWCSMVWVVFRRYPHTRFSFVAGKRALSRITESLSYLALNLGGYFEVGIDNYLIGLMRGAALVTHYDLLSRIYTYVSALTNVLASPLWPSLRSAQQSGDEPWARRVVAVAMLLTVLITTSASLTLAVLHTWVIRAWTGYRYMPDLPLAAALACVNVLTSVAYVQSMTLNARGIVKAQAAFMVTGATLLFIGKLLVLALYKSLWLVPAFTSVYYIIRISVMHILARRRVGPSRKVAP